MKIEPLNISEANEFVSRHHRHHGKLPGGKFAIGISEENEIVGVCLVGRPVSRHFDDGYTLEVTRVCVEGERRNACSMLYGAAWRASKALGYRRLITYTRVDESGASLRGAGWRVIAERKSDSWAKRKARPRVQKTEPFARLLWEAV